MGEIKIKNIGFESAKALQSSALMELQEIYNVQKSAFEMMKDNWQGNSGDDFKRGSNELLCETFMARLTLNDLKQKTLYAETSFKDADRNLKQSIEK